MASGKLLFRTTVSRSIEIRWVVGSGVPALCGYSLWRLSRAGCCSWCKARGGDAICSAASLPRNLADPPPESVGGINKCARESGFDRKNFIRKLVRDIPVKRNSYNEFVRWLQDYELRHDNWCSAERFSRAT